MKALTLTQPWASLVMAGVKRIETRGWRTSYRGPLVIHAAKGWTAADRELADDLKLAGRLPRWISLGCALGTVELVNVVSVDAVAIAGVDDPRWFPLTALERELGDYSPGRFLWLLADPEPFPEPVPCRGALGLWEYPGLTAVTSEARR